ncbi:hypothetical protein PFISCL1PPCAC_17136, partial [Pristionchus fissidentatus]
HSGKNLLKKLEKYIDKRCLPMEKSAVQCRVFYILDHILSLFKVGEITFTNVTLDSFFTAHSIRLFSRWAEV